MTDSPARSVEPVGDGTAQGGGGRSHALAESLEWALESHSRSIRVLARTTLAVDAWSMSVREPLGTARRRAGWTPGRVTVAPLRTRPPEADPHSGAVAWGPAELLRLAPLRALLACGLALLVLGSLAAISKIPVGSPAAYAGRLAPTRVVLVDPPPSPPPPPPVAPPTTAAPAIATAASPTTTTVVLPKPKPRSTLSLAATAGGVWAALRQCESGGNYQENTGNGFYGAYQFVWSTWTSMGYPGRPDQEPPAMQDQAAQRLQARSGWGQWPACSRKLGLS